MAIEDEVTADGPWDDAGRNLEQVVKSTRLKVSSIQISHFDRCRELFRKNARRIFRELFHVFGPLLQGTDLLPPHNHSIKLFILCCFLPKQICNKLGHASPEVQEAYRALTMPIYIPIPILAKLFTMLGTIAKEFRFHMVDMLDQVLDREKEGERDEALENALKQRGDFTEWSTYCQLLLPHHRPQAMLGAMNHFVSGFIVDNQARTAWSEIGEGSAKALAHYMTDAPTPGNGWVQHVELEIGPTLMGGLQYSLQRGLEGRNSSMTSLVAFAMSEVGDQTMKIVLSRSLEKPLMAAINGAISFESIFSPGLLQAARLYSVKVVPHQNGHDIILQMLVEYSEAWRMISKIYWEEPTSTARLS